MLREIVLIDEDKCDGCGLCVPACAEGAIQIIDGKARLVSDTLCDGLGECLGHCPKDAIRIIKRDASPFDESAVPAHSKPPVSKSPATPCPSAGGCPSARFAKLLDPPDAPRSTDEQTLDPPSAASKLAHWPVQLHLLSPQMPAFQNAHLLIAADCVPVAFPDFHRKMLRGRAVAIACPKLDDTTGYVEKLTAIIRDNDLQSVTIAHMEVPCCTGILAMVVEARQKSGKNVTLKDIVIGLRGEILSEREVPSAAAG